MLALALAVTAGTFAAAWHYLHFLPFQREPLSAETLYDLLKRAPRVDCLECQWPEVSKTGG